MITVYSQGMNQCIPGGGANIAIEGSFVDYTRLSFLVITTFKAQYNNEVIHLRIKGIKTISLHR